MVNRVITVMGWIFNILVSLTAFSQPVLETGVTGIFLTVECTKDVPRQHVMMSSRTVCLAQSPIILPKEFKSIGNLVDADKRVYFDLTFTDRGYKALVDLTAKLPQSSLALVVDDEVFFVFKSSEQRIAGTFRFNSPAKRHKQLAEVHQKLEQAIVSTREL